QDVLGVPAGRASLLFPTVNLAVIAGSLLGPRLLGRLGGRRTLLVGFTGIAIGITLLMALPVGGLPVVQLLAAFTLIGAGLGTASVASTQTGTDAADPAYRGVTSGVLNSAAQVGTAVGVALLVPIAAATAWPSLVMGYRIGFLGACAIALAGALSSLLAPVRPASDRTVSKVPIVITCSRSGVVARKQEIMKGNDHHDHAKRRRGAGR
ncbi:MAG TPA: MFS transporter, partial [Propionibacteriaceae bacterium]|nr:MFS transporter [Propionibacteriaceae bacterium]